MTKMKNNTKQQTGFTIVELLIVIVVIGILAAITIVAYSGITARANGVKAQTNAESVQKVAEAYNADQAGYAVDAPTLVTYSGTAAAVAKIPTNVTVSATAVTSSTGMTNVSYIPKGTTGGCIGWWNYGAATPAVQYTYVGNATTGGAGTCS